MKNTTSYGLAHTRTFRRSSKKLITGQGSNLQNIEKSMRAIYESDGYSKELDHKCSYWLQTGDISVFTEEELFKLRVFVQRDQSGAEALIVAYECTAGDYRQLFIHGVKPHVYVALKLFKDVWRSKMKQHGGLIEDLDLDQICNTPIRDLKKNPFWKDLDLLIKDSDHWSLSERYYYLAKQTVHCVDEQTEVLTKNGWVLINYVSDLTEIAICDNEKIKFEIPSSWYRGNYTGDMYYFCGDEIDQYVTSNHKMVYNSNGKNNIENAAYVYTLGRPNIPTSLSYDCGKIDLPDWQIKLLVAIQADANWHLKAGVRFRLVKQRKIDRLISILKEGNIDYELDTFVGLTSAENSIQSITIHNIEFILKHFNGKKLWDSWLLNLSSKNLNILIDELKYWDGTYQDIYLHKRTEYLTKHIQNAEWIKTICHLCNRQGTINFTGDIYKVGINNRKFSIAKVKNKSKVENKPVYCPTVSTGKFLIRRNGKISITHNSSNYDIQWATFIMNILEKSGGKIVINREQGEYFLNTYRELFPEIPERNRRIERQAEDTRILYNLFGFPYQITDYTILTSRLKELYAWTAQSTVAEITRIAFSRMQEFIEQEEQPIDLLADTHDSYLCQCPLSLVGLTIKKTEEFMNQKLISPVDGIEFSMRSECKVGFNWSDFSKENNKLGLRELTWI